MYPYSKIPVQDLCAVYWMERHISDLRASPNEMAFRIPSGGGESIPMSYNVYESTLKLFSGATGRWKYHCTLSAREDVHIYLCAMLEELKALGDWSSDTVFAYLRTPLTMHILNDMRVPSVLSAVKLTEPGLGDSPDGGSLAILPEPE